MSLTNPEKVITEQRLSEFYGEILPYLGGMPEFLANKFSKSDLYSTDEKMIGQWTDGKPVYQKVLTGTTPNTSSQGTFVSTLISIGATVDTICHAEGYQSYQGVFTPLEHTYLQTTPVTQCYFAAIGNSATTSSDRNKIKLFNSRTEWNGRSVFFILQYTKTTDSAVAIGNDTDYSTSEKIIGTWTNGKPVYQKVINIGNLTTVSTEAHKMANVGASVDKFVKLEFYASYGNGHLPLSYFAESTASGTELLPFGGENSDTTYKNQVGIAYKGSLSWILDVYCIAQYTKTTD